MPELHFLRASPRALPLLQDILDQTLNQLPIEIAAVLADDFSELQAATKESLTVYILGFSDHSPNGYIKCVLDDQTAEVFGPFLYPEFQSVELAVELVGQVRQLAMSRDRRVLYSLCPSALAIASEALRNSGFETISSDPEFINRWRDGILADHWYAPTSVLLASLSDD